MNDRIRELAWEAGLLTHNPFGTPTKLDKFAELVIRECARIADVADENKCEWIGGNILTHFGVEDPKPCKSPYCECDIGKCSHPGFYDARGEK